MAVNSRFIQVHPDAIIEWIWDDSFFFEDEYSIITDTKNGVNSFSFSKTVNEPNNYNKIPEQLYLIDAVINRFGIVDPDTKTFLQETKYVNNQPSKFNKIKIWFPIHYVFPASTGFFLKTYALNYENKVPYNLSNYFLDITIPGELNKIDNDPSPFRMNEKLWGKSITLYVPSVYDEALNRVNNAPQLGTINYNLTNGVLGLSQTSPIFIDFRFLSRKQTILGETTYITTPQLLTTVPQAPEYNTLGVSIVEAEDGDYFKINATYNSSAGEFENFMTTLEQSGKRSYVLYAITVYENNLPQETREVYVYKDFLKGIDDYRPVFKYTNTNASIKVEMKLINSIDGNIIVKTNDYNLIGNQVSKYGKYITPINITGALKPKLYNSKVEQNILPPKELLNNHIKLKNNNISEIKYIPYPVLTNIFNVVAGNVTINNGGITYVGQGELNLILTPFDNIIKLSISKKINDTTLEPFVLPSSDSIVYMVFKSTVGELKVSLYVESNEVDLARGIVIFKILATDLDKIKKIREKSNMFYITLKTNDIETSIYNGTYSLAIEK